MCGRFTRKENFQQLAERLGLPVWPQTEPRYNIAPSQPVACVRANPVSKHRECLDLKWGLVPSWAKDPSIGHKMINARVETVALKPSFRNVFKHQRCLVLADGFYEWKREEQAKQPYYIRFKDHRPFVFAGLWEHWETETGPPLESCAILTTNANAVTAPIHDRMPVILHPNDYDLWLDLTIQDPQQLATALKPYPSEEMEAFSISSLVNNPRNDSPLCIRPLES